MSPRYVVYGAGAVGGVVGARLHQSGHDVALIARGPHLDAIRRHGLTLRSPVEEVTLAIPAGADPRELDVGAPGDVVLLAVKGQDTAGALDALLAAGADRAPIVCLQNGVENERLALRSFTDVYGAVVMAPTAHLEPGVVEAYGARASGFIDLGRYPSGIDERGEQICAALAGSRFASRPTADVMRLKHAKLILNLGNVIDALFDDDAQRRRELTERVQAEGRAALDAAGIDHRDPDVGDREGRWERIDVRAIEGRARAGSSSWQSLQRGTRSDPSRIETDYLNGEIVLQGRLHGVQTPLNAAVCRLATDHARRGGRPGELSVDALAVAAG